MDYQSQDLLGFGLKLFDLWLCIYAHGLTCLKRGGGIASG
jgi:hypothetical protein